MAALEVQNVALEDSKARISLLESEPTSSASFSAPPPPPTPSSAESNRPNPSLDPPSMWSINMTPKEAFLKFQSHSPIETRSWSTGSVRRQLQFTPGSISIAEELDGAASDGAKGQDERD